MARFGWRPVFIGLGLVGLLWLFPWIKWMPGAQVASLLREKQTAPSFLEILNQRSAWGVFAGHFSNCYLWFLLFTWTPFYLVRARHLSMDNMAKIASIAYLCMVLFAMLSGWLSDRWIAAGASPTLVRKTFVAAGQTCSGTFLFLCAIAGPAVSVVFLLLAFACYGLLGSNLFAITQALAGPRASGKWTGLENFFGAGAGILAPSLTGFIVNVTGSFVWPFAITMLITALGSLCWVFVVGSVKQVVWAQPRGSDLARTAAEAA